MRGTSGLLLMAIGILHTIYGAVMAHSVLAQISQAAFLDETGRQLVMGLGRAYAFWFLFSGFLMLVLGHLFRWIERRHRHPVPEFTAWELLVLSLLGLAFLPISGFWLILGLSVYMIMAARRFRRAAGATA